MNGDPTDVCCFCDAPLGAAGNSSPLRRDVQAEGNLAVQPEWRREVSSKLRDYRARRRGGATPDLQAALPFEPIATYPPEPQEETSPKGSRPASLKNARVSREETNERFEIAIPAMVTGSPSSPTAADFPSSSRWPDTTSGSAGLSHEALNSVASFSERRGAAIADFVLLLISYGGMLALFTALGGRIGWNKLDLGVAAAAFALFYAQYFALFTIFGGSTPGMMLRGLRVVSFDGGIPTSRQMVWRSFGYLISAGACCLGFVWALWDDDRLCWQDRISQTYLTPSE